MTARRDGIPERRLIVAAASTMVALSLAGCGSGVKTVPVKGVITFGGKPPPHSCVVNFLPTGIQIPSGPVKGGVQGLASGIGECETSGGFQVVCLKNRSGLMPGRYEVLISCFVPNYTTNDPPVSVVPTDFKAPELVVPADARSVRYDVDVPAAAKK